ncbi:hypothetical protein JTB14_004253 [Gonioctena quinquepunctata]|nr:hypothetical protein JTB14_004253 [Gonioctena quinquepunctata]
MNKYGKSGKNLQGGMMVVVYQQIQECIFVEIISMNSLFKNTKKLKSTCVSMSQGLSKEDREDEEFSLNHLKSARQEYTDAKFQGFKLFVGENEYTAGGSIELENNAEREISDHSVKENILRKFN